MGVCEQSMIGVAAGMAIMGLKPYVYSITPFNLERAFEQVKIDIDQQNVNVKLVGYADYPDHGPTHATLDWIVIQHTLQNTVNYFPETRRDVRDYLLSSYQHQKPTIIHLKSTKE